MSTISKLKQLCEVIEAKGLGEEHTCAGHDVIYLLPPGSVEEDSETGQALQALGAWYSREMGWQVYT